jgi:glycerate kinase
VRVLIAPDSFSGTLTATEAAETIAAGWRDHAPHDELTVLPLSDGGPGFLEVVHGALGGDLVSVSVSDPLGRTVPGAFLLRDEGGRRTAYVEAAQACGLHLLEEGEQDPAVTSTYGVGELLAAAVEAGAIRIVVGLGGSGTNDGGAGALAALGAGDAYALGRGGVALAALTDDDLAGLEQVRQRFGEIELVLACDVDISLLGFHGASASYAAGKGATPEVAQQLEAALGHFTDVASRVVPVSTDLLSGEARGREREPGAGADGGLGFGLMLLGGRYRSGVGTVLETVGFDRLLSTQHLLLTGEGTFDWQSLRGKVVAGVAALALEHAVPTVVVAGQCSIGRRETMAHGISGTYAVARSPDEVLTALADPVGTLRSLARRVAVTWSV